jgi:hypothetical protein
MLSHPANLGTAAPSGVRFDASAVLDPWANEVFGVTTTFTTHFSYRQSLRRGNRDYYSARPLIEYYATAALIHALSEGLLVCGLH